LEVQQTNEVSDIEADDTRRRWYIKNIDISYTFVPSLIRKLIIRIRSPFANVGYRY